MRKNKKQSNAKQKMQLRNKCEKRRYDAKLKALYAIRLFSRCYAFIRITAPFVSHNSRNYAFNRVITHWQFLNVI
jgi:hypothetical protein